MFATNRLQSFRRKTNFTYMLTQNPSSTSLCKPGRYVCAMSKSRNLAGESPARIGTCRSGSERSDADE